jgi:hypothetical protein
MTCSTPGILAAPRGPAQGFVDVEITRIEALLQTNLAIPSTATGQKPKLSSRPSASLTRQSADRCPWRLKSIGIGD